MLRCTRAHRCCLAAVGVALGALLAPPPAAAMLIQHNLDFGAFNQSPFQPGGTFTKSDSTLIGPSWDQTLSPGDIPPIGPLYITPSLHTKGKFGAEFGYALSGGSLNITYPVSSTIRVPDSVQLATPFTVSSNVGVNPAGFSVARSTFDVNPLLTPWVRVDQAGGPGYLGPSLKTKFPNAAAWLDLVAQLENRISASATYPVPAFGIPPWETKTDNVLNLKLPGFDVRLPLFELNAGGIQTGVPGASLQFGTAIPVLTSPINGSSILTTTFNYPNLSTSGQLNGGALQSAGEQMVAGLDMNVLQLLATGFPVLGALEGNIPLGIGHVDYTLLRLTAGLGLNLRQEFAFTATPTAFLYFDTPVSVIDGGNWSAPTNLVQLPANGDLRLGFPGGRAGGPVEAQLSYALFNQLQSDTSLVLTGNLKATALEAGLTLDLGFVEIDEGFGPLFGPLGPEGELARFKVCCDAPSFQVNFSPILTRPFQVNLEASPRTIRSRFVGRYDDGSVIYELQEFAGNEFPGERLYVQGYEYPDAGGGTVFLANADVVFDGRNYGRLFCGVCAELDPNPQLVSSDFAVAEGGTTYINDLLMELFSPPGGPPCEACIDDFLAAHSVVFAGFSNDVEIALNRLPELFPIEALPGAASVPLPGTAWLLALALTMLTATGGSATRRRLTS